MNRTAGKELIASYVEGPASRAVTRLGLSPNTLTLLGLPVAGVGAYLLSAGQFAAGGAVVLLSGALDLLDGAVARATGRVTRFGAFLDSNVDRVSEAVVLLGLLVYYLGRPSTTEAELGAVLVYVAIVSSIMVSYTRARAEGLGIECNVGLMTRPERIAVLSIGLIAGQWWRPAVPIALGLVSLLATVTTVQRVLHVRRRLASGDAPASANAQHNEAETPSH